MSELRIVPSPVDPVIRTHALPSIVGVSRAQIHRLIRQGKFPQLLKIGPRASGIRRSTLERWLAEPKPSFHFPSQTRKPSWSPPVRYRG